MTQLQHQFCTVPNCRRPHKARGYCQAHYQQFKRGVPIKAEIATRDTSTQEHCSEQDCVQPVKAKGLCHMHYARRLRHGHTMYRDRKKAPKPCSVNGCENWHYAKGLCHAHYLRQNLIGRKYGITVEQMEALRSKQGGVCAICGGQPKSVNALSGKVTDFNVDHSHATDKVRGLLCSHCNRGIGLFQDSPDILRRAAAYLEAHALT